MANTNYTPGVGSLSLSEEKVYFVNSGDCKIVFEGFAPIISRFAYPTRGSIGLTGQQAYRKTGLQFESDAPSVHLTYGGATGSLAISSEAPELVEATPPSIKILPPLGTLNVTGLGVTLGKQLAPFLPGVGSIAYTGQSITVQQDTRAFPFFDQLALTGQPVTITNIAQRNLYQFYGPIVNTDATQDAGNRANVCDVSGFRAKPGELRKRYDGLMVLPEFWEPRPFTDFAGHGRTRTRLKKGALRPDDTGTETFVDSDDPVEQDDY